MKSENSPIFLRIYQKGSSAPIQIDCPLKVLNVITVDETDFATKLITRHYEFDDFEGEGWEYILRDVNPPVPSVYIIDVTTLLSHYKI